MYKIIKDGSSGKLSSILRVEDDAFIPLSLANTDYANFKSQILADEAELQDADGAVMPAEQAKAFVKELP